jgi:hypothetical protein
MDRLSRGKAEAKPLRPLAQRLEIEHIELQKRLALLAMLARPPTGRRRSS